MVMAGLMLLQLQKAQRGGVLRCGVGVKVGWVYRFVGVKVGWVGGFLGVKVGRMYRFAGVKVGIAPQDRLSDYYEQIVCERAACS